jgi:hypothetical protein
MDLIPTPSPEWACWKLRKRTLQINSHWRVTQQCWGPDEVGLSETISGNLE